MVLVLGLSRYALDGSADRGIEFLNFMHGPSREFGGESRVI